MMAEGAGNAPPGQTGAAIADAAAALIGTPFRLYGRDPAYGLDCVGLALCALRAAGIASVEISGYRLRNHSITRLCKAAGKMGLQSSHAPIAAGDIILARPGPGQFHLLIADDGGQFIHAHAGIGRVARTPSPLAWRVERIWRAVIPIIERND